MTLTSTPRGLRLLDRRRDGVRRIPVLRPHPEGARGGDAGGQRAADGRPLAAAARSAAGARRRSEHHYLQPYWRTKLIHVVYQVPKLQLPYHYAN